MFLFFLLPVALAASVDQKIVGGAEVDIDSYRWQVRPFTLFIGRIQKLL